MDPTSLPVTNSSPGRPQAAISPLPNRLDFVDVDLNSPQPEPEFTDQELVHPDVTLLPKNQPSGDHDDASASQPLPATKPSVPCRRSHKVEATSLIADAASTLPLSVKITAKAVPVQPIILTAAQDNSGPTRDPNHDSQNPGKTSGTPLPDLQTSTTGSAGPPFDDNRSAGITEDAARQALLEFGRRQCCYSTAPAREMSIQQMQHFQTYRYTLETFTEHRSCEWVTELYTGQTANSLSVRPVPQPWDLPVAVPMLFKDGEQKMVMPQTSSIQACSRCNGLGRNMCLKCHGTGRAQCMWCNGTGRRMQIEVCQHCCGNGTESCRMCQNINQQCVTCSGKGRVLTYMQLTVTWKNNEYQFVTEQNTEFPVELFRHVKGEKVFIDEQAKVPPITDFPNPAIIGASQNALEHHRTQFSGSCRILRQRQCIERLPFTQVLYCWQGEQRTFFVYGKENKVFAPNYPKKCCCAVM